MGDHPLRRWSTPSHMVADWSLHALHEAPRPSADQSLEKRVMTALDPLLDALTTAAETGHGYLAARRAVVEDGHRIAAERDMLRRQMASVVDDLGPLLG